MVDSDDIKEARHPLSGSNPQLHRDERIRKSKLGIRKQTTHNVQNILTLYLFHHLIRSYLAELQQKNPDNLSRFLSDAVSTSKGLVFLLTKDDRTILKWYTTNESVMNTHLPNFIPSDSNGWKISDTHELANKLIEGLTLTSLIIKNAAEKRL